MAQMVPCKKCGHRIKENVKTCPYCGTRNKIYNIRMSVGILCLFLGLALLWSARTGKVQETDSGNYVTRLNYDIIASPMTYDNVCEMFGTPGQLIPDAEETLADEQTAVYVWLNDDGSGSCRIVFTNDCVSAKTQDHLR